MTQICLTISQYHWHWTERFYITDDLISHIFLLLEKICTTIGNFYIRQPKIREVQKVDLHLSKISLKGADKFC